MPGPVRRRGRHLLEAHSKGLVDTSFIDASAARVLELLHKTGKSQIPDWKEEPERAVDLPEHRKILRRAGAEGLCPFKRDGNVKSANETCRHCSTEERQDDLAPHRSR